MLTTPMILLGILAAVVFFYLLAQIGNSSQPERHSYHPASPPPGYASTPVYYQPPPVLEEEPPISRASYWPIFLLAGAVAVLYLGSKYTGAQANVPSIQENSEDAGPDNSFGDYIYDNEELKDNRYYPPKKRNDNRYYQPEEKKAGYTVPLPSPSTRREARESQRAQAYDDGAKAQTTIPKQRSKVLDYRQGYGVQLFATEKGWWEEADLRQIQENYPHLQLLIGTSYNSGNMNKFILGAFNTKATAGQFARQAGKAFPGAYVVDLSELERVDRYWTVP